AAKGFQCPEQCTGLIINRKDKAGFVTPLTNGWPDLISFTDDKKAGYILRAILYVFRHNRYPMEIRCQSTCDRSYLRVLLCLQNCLRGTRTVYQLSIGQVAIEPLAALADSVILGEHFLYLLQRASGDKTMRNLEIDL